MKKFLKYNERFKVEENLPKMDLTMEGIFYDEDFYVPEFIYIPKKKKKHADFDEVEIEKYPFIGIKWLNIISENYENQFETKKFEKDSGFDLYIDGGRYLPNSATISKIMIRILDSNLKDVITPQTAMCQLESSIYHPSFNFR